MTKRAKKIHETLKELMVGIAVFGVLCLFAGVWFVTSGYKYVLGLLIGLILAEAGAVHMYWGLNRNLTFHAGRQDAANAYSVKNSLLRYAVILIVFFVVCVTDVVYPLAVFLGIMGLKAGAYLQPFIHKVLKNK